MSTQQFGNGINLKEKRLLRRESSFGEHMGEYKDDWIRTYVSGKKGLDRGLGAIGGAADLLLKGPDRLYRGAVGQPYDSPHGIFGHTRADIGNLVSDVFRLRPLRALGDAWSLVTSDVPLDTINLLTGNNLNNTRSVTRTSVSRVLAA